jgi:hypothetical protein
VKRREFITLLGGAAAAWPLTARAQQPARVPRIGIVDDAPMWHSVRQALREFGYVEGQSINYEYRYSEGVPARPPRGRGGRARPPPGRPDRGLRHAADGSGQGGDDDDPDRDDRRR